MHVLAQNESYLSVEALTSDLASREPIARERARKSLIALRSPEVVAALSGLLEDADAHVRWEAAKTLIHLQSPAAASVLVRALEDESEDVRWLSSQALIGLGEAGVMPVLKALMRRASSMRLCEGAYRVLRAIDEGPRAALLTPVLAALHDSEPGVAAPPAAFQASLELESLENAPRPLRPVKLDRGWDA